jgi:ankyrin repeat protein
MRTKKQEPMTFERLVSRSFGKESFGFWHTGPCGLRIEEVQRYLDEGGDVNRRTEAGQTLLHIAADNLQADIIRLLLSRGADINAKGYLGQTALHYAVDMEAINNSDDVPCPAKTDMPITRMLIELGADESIRSDQGETARDWAVEYEESDLYDSISRESRTKS